MKTKLPCSDTFKQRILPALMDQLERNISVRLNLCLCLSLVVDIWTNQDCDSFISLAAFTINKDFNREFYVIGNLTFYFIFNAKYCFNL